jgi:hypothetical protein
MASSAHVLKRRGSTDCGVVGARKAANPAFWSMDMEHISDFSH